MRTYFTLAELVEMRLPGLPTTVRGLSMRAEAEGWRAIEGGSRKATGRQGGGGFEYNINLLSADARAKLALVLSGKTEEEWKEAKERKAALWARYNRLTKAHKDICEDRLKVLRRVEELTVLGISREQAITVATHDADVQKSAYYEWRKLVENLDEEDWLAALAPNYVVSADPKFADCHPKAWEILKSDFLRLEKPKFSACYRRMKKVADRDGLEPIPSERALRRRFEAEVSKAAVSLKRDGREKARGLHPAQRRSRTHLHAMQMVNMDGHKLDVFVKVPWSTKPIRFYLIGIQDLYSGKVLSFRLAEAETWEAVRLVLGDMVESFGIPEVIYLDNGKAFASKWITGDAVRRFRFKVKPEDPRGLLSTLGIEPRFTRPYSGQSKPIERAWGDLAEAISKHPFCAGAYTGNKPDAKPENYASRAIDWMEFREHVAEQIADHNAQQGRKAQACKGRSFDQTFADSMASAGTHVRVPTAGQATLWLLASEAIQTKKGSGEIHYQGNRYWDVTLNQYAGQKVVIRFDPDALHEPVKVYDLKSRLLCEARCIDDAGFDNVDAARAQAKAVKGHLKAVAEVAESHARLSAQQLGEIYYKGGKPKAPEPEQIRPAVTRLVTGNLALSPAPVDAVSEQTFESSFSRALSMVHGGGAVIEFPNGNPPVGIASGGQHEPKSNVYGSAKKKGGKTPAR